MASLLTLSETESLGYFYLSLHGLTNWTFEVRSLQEFEHLFDGAELHACTYYAIRAIALDPICLTPEYPFPIQDVLLHEVAHALLPHGEDHSRRWIMLAYKIGVSATHLFRYAHDLVNANVTT